MTENKTSTLSPETESFVKGYREGLNEAFKLSKEKIDHLLDCHSINHEIVNRLRYISKALDSYIVEELNYESLKKTKQHIDELLSKLN